MENKVNQVLDISMEKIRQMVDVSAVIGDPIVLGEQLTVIPISKVSYGFAGGGSDLPNKSAAQLFGGGSGAGINITPISLLVVKNGEVRLMPVSSNPDKLDQIVNMVPELINKVSALLHKDKDAEQTAAE